MFLSEHCSLFFVHVFVLVWFTFSAFTLLAGRQEEQPAPKN